MHHYTVMIVEDDERLRATIEDYLTLHEYKVILAANGYDAIDLFQKNRERIHLIILDGMLPGLDGYEVLKSIRKASSVPVIILSARETEEDQLNAFALGANTYMTKPFLLSVLEAQIRAFLRKDYNKYEVLKKGALTVETGMRRVSLDGREIEMTPKEYEVLVYLMKNERIVLDRNTILDNVWGQDYFGNDRTVDTIIKQLRKKLTPEYSYIKSVYGVGYYFEAK